MPSTKNISSVADLQGRVQKSKSTVFAQYTGMTVKQQQALRQAVKVAGGEVMIAKNRLLNIAFGKPAGMDKMLENQVLTVFSYEDEVAAVKAIVKYAKDNETPKIRGGFFENAVIDQTGVEKLAKLPGRSELVVQLLQRLQSPAYGFRNVLEAVPRNLVYALQAIARKQETK
jgi:large subunit ribosomal protein L10